MHFPWSMFSQYYNSTVTDSDHSAPFLSFFFLFFHKISIPAQLTKLTHLKFMARYVTLSVGPYVRPSCHSLSASSVRLMWIYAFFSSYSPLGQRPHKATTSYFVHRFYKKVFWMGENMIKVLSECLYQTDKDNQSKHIFFMPFPCPLEGTTTEEGWKK